MKHKVLSVCCFLRESFCEENTMLKKNLAPIGLALLFLGTFCATSSAAWERTLIVGQPNASCANAQYPTITAAVKAAAPGDVVEICPALYPEQLTITMPLTLRGLDVDGIKRVLIQPSSLVPVPGVDNAVGGLPSEAVITVMNTHGVTIENLAIDAGNNKVTDCSPVVSGIHYFNSSGSVKNNAISGAQVTGCTGASALLFGNGFGVQVDADQTGDFDVSVEHNSIHNFTRDGIQVIGSGVTARIEDNAISGVGPSTGVFQFGVFILNGAVGVIKRNVITEGLCGTVSISACFAARSEGVTLRAVGDGTVIDHNVITNAQSGIFINGANDARITDNLISNIDVLDGIDIQGTASGSFTNSRIDGNTIFNVVVLSIGNESCGVFESPGTGVSGNTISHTTVNDAYCGVAHVATDHVESGDYHNTLYTELNSDLPTFPPPPVEP
jgi:nitrous oxidase accessory protein NosD